MFIKGSLSNIINKLIKIMKEFMVNLYSREIIESKHLVVILLVMLIIKLLDFIELYFIAIYHFNQSDQFV